MWHLCWLDLMKWQIIGAVPCVGSSLSPILCIVQILHDLFADGSSIKAFFLKKKKNCLQDELFKTQNAVILLDQPKAWCWAQQARCTGLSVRLPTQRNCPDSWDSIFDINKWLGQSPRFPALASFTLKPFRKNSLQFKGQLHFRKTQARLLVPRLLKSQFCWKVVSALMIRLIVEYFSKALGGLFCFQSPPILCEQSETSTEILSFKMLLYIFFPTDSLAFPCLVLNTAFTFRPCNLNLSHSWAR